MPVEFKAIEKRLFKGHYMKKLIGQSLVVRTDGVSFKGILREDSPDRIVLEDAAGLPVVIIKNKIAAYAMKNDETEKIKLANKSVLIHVLYCCNKNMGCQGVRYFKEGRPEPKDFDLYMADCPKRNANCQKAILGELDKLPKKIIAKILNRTIVGDYPDA